MSEQLTLNKGDTIGLVTPSSPLRVGRLELGLQYLNAKGFKVKLGKHLQDSNRFMAGSDYNRAHDIMDFFKDESVKVIMATGGGYGSQRLLPLLDFDLIRANPKLLTGFSDTTALQLGLLTKANLTTFTGFGFRDLEEGGPDPLIERTLFSCLKNESYSIQEGNTAISGQAEGILIAGTLSLITALIGTPFQPNFKNAILLVEEVFAEPYQVDCMLSQLELAGMFKQINGIIFGQFVFARQKIILSVMELSTMLLMNGSPE
jgi:muramoyltetrapeptide carboxypeptidase